MKARLVLCFLFFHLLGVIGYAQSLDEGLQKLTEQISSNFPSGKKHKIAIVEFSDLQGQVTELGKFISEELVTRLFMSKKFIVIERQLLNKILEEQKLGFSGYIDEKTAIKLGKILGVETICSGTITDLVDSIKLNARMVSTETGSLFAVAATKVVKNEVIRTLMKTQIQEDQLTSQPKKNKNNQKVVTSAKSKHTGTNVFFSENFSTYEDGETPQRWTGIEHCLVNTKQNRKVLTPFEPGAVIITIPNIDFPNNFKLKWVLRVSEPYYLNMDVQIGNLKAGIYARKGNNAFINKSKQKLAEKLNKNVPIAFELKKANDIFRFSIDGRDIILSRYPNFKSSNSLILKLNNSKYKYDFDLLSIEGVKITG